MKKTKRALQFGLAAGALLACPLTYADTPVESTQDNISIDVNDIDTSEVSPVEGFNLTTSEISRIYDVMGDSVVVPYDNSVAHQIFMRTEEINRERTAQGKTILSIGERDYRDYERILSRRDNTARAPETNTLEIRDDQLPQFMGMRCAPTRLNGSTTCKRDAFNGQISVYYESRTRKYRAHDYGDVLHRERDQQVGVRYLRRF